jgi:proteic killer suppression protein
MADVQAQQAAPPSAANFVYQIGKQEYTSCYREALLDIEFANKQLRELCERRASATRKFGDACARKLHSRLADLTAASNVMELVAGRPHALLGRRDGQYAVDLSGGFRLVFSAANDPLPRRADRSVDWSRVTIIRIEYIGDYHE